MPEPVIVPLSPGQRALLAGYEAKLSALTSQRQAAVDAVLAGVMSIEDLQGCRADLTPDGIVVHPQGG